MGTVFVLLIVVLLVGLVLRGMIRDKKAGKGGCSCGCESCASKGMCHQSKT